MKSMAEVVGKGWPMAETCPTCNVPIRKWCPPDYNKSPIVDGGVRYCHCERGEVAKAEDERARAEALAQRLEAEAKEREADRLIRLRRASIPPRYQDCTLDSFPQQDTDVYRRVVQWAGEDDSPNSLYLYGSVGTGKTGLACGLLRRLVMTDVFRDALFTTTPGLLDSIRQAFTVHSEADPLDRVKAVRMLVLDDIGAEKVTDWVAERLFVLIDHRYSYNLPTIFTSNLSLVELGQHIGVRAASRIGEMALAVELKGTNLRVKR